MAGILGRLRLPARNGLVQVQRVKVTSKYRYTPRLLSLRIARADLSQVRHVRSRDIRSSSTVVLSSTGPHISFRGSGDDPESQATAGQRIWKGVAGGASTARAAPASNQARKFDNQFRPRRERLAYTTGCYIYSHDMAQQA
jgi:hypothetical protein